MNGEELQATQVEFDGAPGVRLDQVAEVVDELGLRQGVDVVGKVGTEVANGARVGVNGFGLQSFEFEVFEMRLVLPIKVRTGADGGGGVYAGISSRSCAKSRLGIEGARLQNNSWGCCWGLLRVAASSNPALKFTLSGRWDAPSARHLAPR
ncbi:hypothetical protein BLL52_0157 [Rhodoferax antarcticus ANT.BR]|uniref:Uncharacterized protein n=1 Tax=Rhodoferax antarcticus ANT.BR TaxID=1111071 RepID=A0A1Q8YKX2_9BURK|nr:hypothetical protein [Rhodoferax antarcticus]OLP08550.1 hypothetical protein BLL52_0157 [Rhodoferax antarcticus ANT.BR]